MEKLTMQFFIESTRWTRLTFLDLWRVVEPEGQVDLDTKSRPSLARTPLDGAVFYSMGRADVADWTRRLASGRVPDLERPGCVTTPESARGYGHPLCRWEKCLEIFRMTCLFPSTNALEQHPKNHTVKP